MDDSVKSMRKNTIKLMKSTNETLVHTKGMERNGVKYEVSIKVHPFCEMCLKENKATLVEEVHHVLPLSRGETHDESNLISLCKSCHSKIHAKMGVRFNR